jgi:CheY-like chemotaxis protein/signal transduction histidine kinase
MRFDGSTVAVELSGGLCTASGRSYICVVARDVESRLQAEEARARADARRADSARLDSLAVFAGEMAHDFNDVLTGLLGQTSLALARVSTSSPAYRHIKAAEAAALRAVGLTDELQMCAGKGRAAPSTFDLNGLVEEMEEQLHGCVGQGVELRMSLAAVLPAIEADPAHIRRMIQHVVVELADDDQESDERRTLWLTTGASYVDQGFLREAELGERLAPGSYVWLEVRDPARTLDEAGRRRLFDPTSDPSTPGRGFGLAAALGVLRAHGGAIRASSDADRGLTLRVLLPASSRAAEELSQPPGFAAAARGAVLVVDDDDTAREAIREMVEQAGYMALTAPDGDAAIDLCRRNEVRFAAALVDASMPGVDGGEVLREFRRLNPDLPVVVMSGYPEQDAADRGALEGAAGFLQKPFGVRRLVERLTELLPQTTVH